MISATAAASTNSSVLTAGSTWSLDSDWSSTAAVATAAASAPAKTMWGPLVDGGDRTRSRSMGLVVVMANSSFPGPARAFRVANCAIDSLVEAYIWIDSLVNMKRTGRQAGSNVAGAPLQVAKAEPQAKKLRKKAGTWLKDLRARAGLSQIELAERLGFKYYTFISQVENGFGRVPTESLEEWARALGVNPASFARELLSYYDPELHRLLFEVKR
jgi:DNA-binding XRE family transcriptional regulator